MKTRVITAVIALAFFIPVLFFLPTVVLTVVCGVLMAALATFMHRENIRRLLNKQERKTNLFGKGSKQ